MPGGPYPSQVLSEGTSKLPYSRENDYYFLLTDKDTGAVMEKRPVKIDIAGVKKEE